MKFFCLLILVAFSAQNLVAQKEKERKTEVIKLGGEAIDKPSSGGLGDLLLHVKSSPFEFLFGAQSVYTEVGLADWFSIEAGVGLTFRPVIKNDEILKELNFYFGSSDDKYSDQWDNPGQSDINDNPQDFSYRKAMPGFRFTVSPRIFFRVDEGLDGWYLAPVFQYTRWNFKAQEALHTYYQYLDDVIRAPDYTQKEMFQKMDLLVNSGTQLFHEHLVFDIIWGVGVSLQKGLRQDLGTVNYYVTNRELSYSKMLFVWNLGFKMGYRIY